MKKKTTRSKNKFNINYYFKKLRLSKWLKDHTASIDTLSKSKQVGLWIALAAGVGLFLELMLIRIHSSYFQLFAYLKNVSLLSCFLGLGIGYARVTKKPLYTPLVLPFLALQVIALYLFRFTNFAFLLQNPIPEQLSLGLSNVAPGEIYNYLFIYGFLGTVFVFNALCFIPLGHLAARLMAKQKPLIAYSWNLVGSLVGILLFSLISFAWLPPVVWFVIAALLLMIFFNKDKLSFVISALSLIAVVIILVIPFKPMHFDTFSPYQILTIMFNKDEPPLVMTNNSYYQKILDLRPEKIVDNEILQGYDQYYSLPYLFKPEPNDVLIVGSGTGNDVASALRNNSKSIDAVEIDPAIMQFGKKLHPEQPYSDSRVKSYANDARAFLRSTDRKYDLIVYGLLDSHTLLASKGGIRLDSYVYTVEGLKEAKARLKDDGAISLSFALMSGEMGRKLYLMLEEAFDGQTPIIFQSRYDQGYTFLISNNNTTFANKHEFFKNVTSDWANEAIVADVSTDDWPFFYMPIRKFPKKSMALVFVLLGISVLIINKFVPKTKSSFSTPAFFLGAGFMLLETKGVTELALVYGSTWYVNSIIIISILLMGFFANIVVIKKKALSRQSTYLALFASLVVSFGFTYLKLFGSLAWLSKIIMPIGLTLPLFFSGMAFSLEVKRISRVSTAIYSNLLGAMLGGFLEYNSMYFGFRSLYFLALGMYILAFLEKKIMSVLKR